MTDKLSNINVTSEACVLPEMTGKYDLVFFASQRARAIINGSAHLIEGFENAKNHAILIALEEIRTGALTFDDMIESLSSPHIEAKEPERVEALSGEDNFDEDDEENEDDKIDYKSEEEYED